MLRWLVLSGVVPFAILAIAAVARVLDLPVVVRATAAYAAVLLSFVGGIRWGAEVVRDTPDTARLALAACPPVLAWGALIFPNAAAGLSLLLVAGAAHLAWDLTAARAGLIPAWSVRMRVWPSIVSTLCILVILGVVTLS